MADTWSTRLGFGFSFVNMAFGSWLGGSGGLYLWEFAKDGSEAQDVSEVRVLEVLCHVVVGTKCVERRTYGGGLCT